MPREKVKFALRIRPETQELVREMYPRDNCQSQNEFIEKAIHFYAGYVASKDVMEFLPPIYASALRAIIQSTENRISRLLFKLAVEMDMMMNVLASAVEIDREDIREQRGRSIQNVKKTGGSIALEDAVDAQAR